MRGTINIPFSELFSDSVKAHGTIWAWEYYVKKGKMAEWEYSFWLRKHWGMLA